jgi:hypothetical protein
MSRFSRFIAMAAAAVFAVACTNGAKVSGNLADAPASDVVVKLLDVNRYEILDTVKTDAAGNFSYKLEVVKGQPEFVYLFHNDVKVASLLLEAGDKVKVQADTLGNFTVSGSEESEKLAQVERDYAAALAQLSSLADQLEDAKPADAAEVQKQMGQAYLNYYRNSVRYVLTNSRSLTSVPVFFQSFSAELPVFGQLTDALHFRNVADTLETVYPDSKYVKALRNEADRRMQYLELDARLSSAEEIGYPEIELPDAQGNKIKLSDVDAKVVMVYFWTSSNTSQKMFNLDFLKSLYDDYHKYGFEIYQVALDPDKALWAKVVKEQKLDWVNVCDSRGGQSPYVIQYNLTGLPSFFVISDGALVDGQAVDDKSLRKLISDLLK